MDKVRRRNGAKKLLSLVVLLGVLLVVPWPLVESRVPVEDGQNSKTEAGPALVAGSAYGWHTFYGSVDFDRSQGIALDGDGNVYVVGYSSAAWNGPTGQPPLNAHSGTSDGTVLKLDSAGTYQWHTFYGFTIRAVVVDASGNLYVTGGSSVSWDGPTGQPPLQAHSGVASDITVLKLDSAGSYRWHTFCSAEDDESGSGIAVDANGHVYVTGVSYQWSYSAIDRTPFHPQQLPSEIVVLKLDSAGAYQWQVSFGLYSESSGLSVVTDSVSNVYVAGNSVQPWNGPAGQPPLHSHSGANYDGLSDIVVLKLDQTGAYRWHTFYGSTADDWARAITVDRNGGVYAAAHSMDAWTGPEGLPPLHAHSGSCDLAVLKLDHSGAYSWHAFYGSASGDYAYALAVDGLEDLYVAGHSGKSWQGPAGQPPLQAHSGAGDLVVLKLDSTGAYQWHLFRGSPGESDYAMGIALDGSDDAYFAGYSGAAWSGPAGQAPLNDFSGKDDIFVLKIDMERLYLPLISR